MFPTVQGSNMYFQGSSPSLQGSNTNIQGSSINPQATVNGFVMNNSGSTVVPWATDAPAPQPQAQQDPNAQANQLAAQQAATAKSNALGQYTQAIGTYQDSLNRLPGQLGIAQDNINSQFNTNQNQLNSTKAQSQNSYDNSNTQNSQSFQSNKNTIADQASSGLRGLLRTLGAYGAGGSSEAQYTAPQAVADQASQQRAGAGQTFAQNQAGLDTNFNNFLNQDANSRKQLNDWQSNQLNSAQAQSDTTKQSILTELAKLYGGQAQVNGGNYASSAQPYIDQAQGLNSTIDNLGKLNPTYNGTTPVYNAPSLSSYISQANGTQVNNNNASTTPYLAQLLGLDKNKTKA